MTMLTPCLPLLVCVLVASAPAVAQRKKQDDGKDRRDRVTLQNGKVLRGRVLNPFWRDELILKVGGNRQRISRKQVRDVRTIHEDLHEFFAYRKAMHGKVKREWFLVEWASSKKLPGIAKLQALAIVLANPKSKDASVTKAREFLGHKKRGETWLWPVANGHKPRAEFVKHHAKWGKALELTGEHFKIKTDAGVERTVEMLFDLERLYLHWMDTFGAGLDMHEALQPIPIHVWASSFTFPKISALQLPYYRVANQTASTFFRPDAKRPEQLFAIATQAMIYATLVEARPTHERSHLCAWAEVGLGLWVESGFAGKPGFAVPLKAAKLDSLTASTMFRSRPRLKRVIHLHYELYFEMSDRVAIRWGATETLVHYLMSRKPDPKMRERFFSYLHRVFRKGLGDSSTAFDKAMGKKVEAMQPSYLRWLQVRQ